MELGFSVKTPMAMYCDNQSTIFITNNPNFHERTKHIKVDYHYVRDMVMRGTPYTQSLEQLTNIFTKDLVVGVFETLCTKLSIINIYTSD